MNTKMKLAMFALNVHDMADAAIDAAPSAVTLACAPLLVWILSGLDAAVTLVAFAGLAVALMVIAITFTISAIAIRLLGFTEEQLEHWRAA